MSDGQLDLRPVQLSVTTRNDILEAEGVVPDYEDGIRITGELPSPSLCELQLTISIDAKTLQVARVRDPSWCAGF